jgi:hypothetical protein
MAAHEGSEWQGRHTAERLDDIKGHINRLREFMLNSKDTNTDAAADPT